MVNHRFSGVLVLICCTTLLLTGSSPAAEVGDQVEIVALNLVESQGSRGSWQIGFNGSIITGLVNAYEYTGNESFLTAARNGGDSILADALNGLFGDDAYALMRLSEHASDPAKNIWRTYLSEFYRQMRSELNYLSAYRSIDPSIAVFYLSNHVVAAQYAGATDKDLWRRSLIQRLADVDDSSDYPVMALAMATWALAQTGPLDGTSIGSGASWNGKTLADLPAMLLSHQVPDGQDNAGTFYWRFDHNDDGSGSPVSGYTEDTVFAVLGLVTASRTNPQIQVDAAVDAARDALLSAADMEGQVHMSLAQSGISHPAFAGELLQVLPELDPVWAMGSCLTSGQTKTGGLAGGWSGEEDFTGTLLTGLLSVVRQFPHNPRFEQAFVLASQRVLSHSNFFGDEAYGLACLSAAAANPSNNPFRSKLAKFYEDVKQGEGGSEWYIGKYAEIENSQAAFYLAHHVLAAHAVNAADKDLWRNALIGTLAEVDDSAEYPVMALGLATWALAKTGSLDGTPISDNPDGLWAGKTLADLPAMLLSHQVPDGQDNAGTFFWRFDHGDGGSSTRISGYTEDAVFGLLGLDAAQAAVAESQDESLAAMIQSAVASARTELTEGAGGSGRVYEHLSGDGASYYSYAAEILMALGK